MNICMDVDTALSEVPVNLVPLTDDTDFVTIEESVAYNATGLELIWHFVTSGGAYTATVVTPTTGGDYDWSHQDGGMYTIELPASGGASANNDTEGFGWFTGVADGVLPWRGPTICFRAAALNDADVDGGDVRDVNLTQWKGTAPADLTDTDKVQTSPQHNVPTNFAALGIESDGDVTKVNSLDGHTAQTGDSYAIVNSGTHGNAALKTLIDTVDGVVDSVLVDTGTTLDGKINTIDSLIDTLVARLTAARAGYLDNLDGHTAQTGDTFAALPSNFASLGINASGHVSRVTLVDTTTTNTDMRGTDSANTTTPPTAAAIRTEIDSNSTQLAAIKAKTDTISAGGDATEANQTTIIGHLTDIMGSTFSGATDSLEAIRDRGDAAWTDSASGDGDTAVSSTDTDDDDELMAVQTAGGSGIEDVTVRAYLKSEYDAGTYTIRARTTTGADGAWGPIYLNSGSTYTLTFEKSGFVATSTEITVS